MSELTDKFHDGVTVKLRCGGVLEGIRYPNIAYLPAISGQYETQWYDSGSYTAVAGFEHPFDIVDVLSEKSQPTLEECLNSGNLCGGMTFMRGEAKLTICVVNGEYYAAFDNNRTLLYRVDAIHSRQPWILSDD